MASQYSAEMKHFNWLNLAKWRTASISVTYFLLMKLTMGANSLMPHKISLFIQSSAILIQKVKFKVNPI